jgi:uncharacterized damage-inducible protein DinB
MKRMFLLFAVLAASLAAAPPTNEERKFAAGQLRQSRKTFLKSIQGLSEEQWKFKPAADRWSIAECAEHITISEEMLLQLVTQKILKSDPVPRTAPVYRQDDEEIIKSTMDRSRKAAAPEFLRPASKWATRDELIKEFKTRRERTIEYIRTTQEDLRSHVLPSGPGRSRDAYQYVLLLSAHAERHAAQIDEVKSAPNFPKKRKRLGRDPHPR